MHASYREFEVQMQLRVNLLPLDLFQSMRERSMLRENILWQPPLLRWRESVVF